jgi:hypothetical protein
VIIGDLLLLSPKYFLLDGAGDLKALSLLDKGVWLRLRLFVGGVFGFNETWP